MSCAVSEKENCPCKKKKCERHGNCYECRKHHEEPARRAVACERIKTAFENLKNKDKNN